MPHRGKIFVPVMIQIFIHKNQHPMRHFLFLLMALLIQTSALFAQANLLQQLPVKPHSLSVRHSPELIQRDFNGTLTETLDYVLDSMTALTPIKGFNAAMLLPDGSMWKRAAGLATELPSVTPLTTEHLMGMGSISKSFVATTLLLLYEDDLLDLDDSIGQYVGPYPNVPGSVTIRQLLSHRSGISDYLNENPATGGAWLENLDSIWVSDTVLSNYVLAPNFPVGTDWSYSNTNYLLAGRIIESLTGQPWHDVVRQRLLDPLGLTHTFVYPWETPEAQPFSHVWADFDSDGSVEDLQGLGLPDVGLFSLANSAGCLISTPEDLVRFSERVYGGHVLQPATLTEMQTDYEQSGSGFLYGLGAASFPIMENVENWGHDGDLLYKSVALYFPSENMSLAVQQNDDRLADPDDPELQSDVYIVYAALLEAYLNYSPASGTADMQQDEAILISPNPVDDRFAIQFAEKNIAIYPIICTLTDVNGRIVLSQTVWNNRDVFSVEQLPSGVYWLQAGRFSGKVVKK